MLRKFAKYVGQLQVRRTESISRCGKCGLISQEEVCSFCKLTERASGQAAGLFLRESIRNLLKPRSLNPSP